jgi:hypothetical protein
MPGTANLASLAMPGVFHAPARASYLCVPSDHQIADPGSACRARTSGVFLSLVYFEGTRDCIRGGFVDILEKVLASFDAIIDGIHADETATTALTASGLRRHQAGGGWFCGGRRGLGFRCRGGRSSTTGDGHAERGANNCNESGVNGSNEALPTCATPGVPGGVGFMPSRRRRSAT